MRSAKAFLLFTITTVSVVIATGSDVPQVTNVEADQQAISELQAAIAAMSPGKAIADVTLVGSARLFPSRVSADVVVKCKGFTESSVTYSAGPLRAELRNDSPSPSGKRTDSSGTSHQTPFHNSLLAASILTPTLLLRGLTQPGSHIKYIGTELSGGAQMVHIQYFHSPPHQKQHITTLIEHLSTLDLYFDQSHQLVKLAFNIHPDDNASLDIPTEIRFSDYRPVDGDLLPFHIERLINGSLNMDLTIDQTILNAGLSDADFSVE